MPEQAVYTGTPLPRKLGIGEGDEVALIGAPERFEDTLGSCRTSPASTRTWPTMRGTT